MLGPADTFYFHYSLLGVDISTEPFPSLEEPNFLAEKATAQILACPPVLSSFLAREEPPIMLLSEEPPTKLPREQPPIMLPREVPPTTH